MLNYNDKIAVGLSGGKDSLSLLYVLKKILSRKGNSKLIAITIDEGITGYREESLEIVDKFCRNLNIKNEIFTYKDLFNINMDEAVESRPSKKMTSCSICGTFRRRAIDIAAKLVQSNTIATGHNLDDQLQSFMINIISGDIDRIGWIYPEPEKYDGFGLKKIKPFIELYEREIVFYALQQDIPFQSEQCPYMNESIRTDLREFLNELERTRSGVKYNIYNSITKISKKIKNSAGQVKSKCVLCGHDTSGTICSVCNTLTILKKD